MNIFETIEVIFSIVRNYYIQSQPGSMAQNIG